MAWLIVVIAGLFEIGFAVSLKFSEGLTRPFWVVTFLISVSTSMFLLAQALRWLPVGVAYAIFTGVGTAGTAIVGMTLLGESRDPLKIASLVVILAGIIGLQLATASSQ